MIIFLFLDYIFRINFNEVGSVLFNQHNAYTYDIYYFHKSVQSHKIGTIEVR